MNITHPEDILPLTPQAQYILLALAKAPNSGYGIIKQAAADSQNIITLSPGTVYPTLKRFLAIGYVEQTAQSAYRLTNMGRDTLQAEITRQTHIAQLYAERPAPAQAPTSGGGL